LNQAAQKAAHYPQNCSRSWSRGRTCPNTSGPRSAHWWRAPRAR